MANGLHLFQSNCFATLSARLLAELGQAPPDPFTPEYLIVPGTAVQRKLEQACARHFGVAANVRFRFLAQWVWEQIGRVVPVARESPFSGERLPWRLYRAFGEPAFRQADTRLARYLAHAAEDPVMRLELAQRVARVLEQCILYRSRWIRAWAQGQATGPHPLPDEDWLASLWRWLARELDLAPEHPAEAFFQHLRGLAPAHAEAAALPGRVSVFCPGDIPPLYLEVLSRLGEWMEIRLYLLNPCREYWDLIVSPRRLAQLEARETAEHHEIGHPLLAAWGRQAQGLFALLGDTQGWSGEDSEFHERPGASLLATVQNQILDLAVPVAGAFKLAEADHSIAVHVCHSLARQLEVLQDQLLERFATERDLRADQILVVLPQLEQHAPLIHAIFGSAPLARHLPYQIVGLPRTEANPVARGVLLLLRLLRSRCLASEVFHLLSEPLVSARFGLDAARLETLHDWLEAADVRWGLSAGHRERAGLPGGMEFTFAEGLDRLYLGFALPEGAAPFAGLLPVPAVEGIDADALGRLDRFVEDLEHAQRRAATTALPAEWGGILEDWLKTFFLITRDSAEDLAEVRLAVQALIADLAAAGLTEALPIAVIERALNQRLQDPAHGAVPTGAVTFAGMTPLRHLPYQIICVLGMEEGVFPALQKPDEFDLIAHAPQTGDRQRRLDDRNVFLDLLLAARRSFYVSYTGRHQRDDSPLPPSVLVSELLEHLLELIGPERAAAARAQLVTEHPLQAFSASYFSAQAPPSLFSYATEYLEGLCAQHAVASAGAVPVPEEADAAGRGESGQGEEGEEGEEGEGETFEWAAPFFDVPLPLPERAARSITLADLQDFLLNPARHWLRQGLQISLRGAAEELEDEEPFGVEWTRRETLAARLLPALQAGAPDQEVLSAAVAGREYPAGALGHSLLQGELCALRDYARRLPPPGGAAPAWEVSGRFEAEADGRHVVLEDTLSGTRQDGFFCHRYAPAGERDRLRTWASHLFFNAAQATAGCDPQRRTRFVGRGPGFSFGPCAEAGTHLQALLRLYAQGLRAPVRFAPRTALCYAGELAQKGRESALREARAVWRGREDHRAVGGQRGECNSPDWRLVLRDAESLVDAEFERCASLVCTPLLAHLEEDG